MIVDVDIGNSYVKWRIDGRSDLYYQPTTSLDDGWQAEFEGAQRVRLACVAGARLEQVFVAEVFARWQVVVEVAKVTRGIGGIEPAYHQLERLGVDRWLSMLAIRQRVRREFVVVSVGTALTADWVDAIGRHLGGYIAPGQHKMLDVLHSGVANVLQASAAPALSLDLSLGKDTEACVMAGVSAMMSGFVKQVAEQEPQWPIFVAGGGSRAIADLCAQQHKIDLQRLDNPVLDGLAIALP